MVIVAGGLDDFEYRAGKQYACTAGGNTQVWVIENAWHVSGPTVIPDEYSRRMLAFFDMSLKK